VTFRKTAFTAAALLLAAGTAIPASGADPSRKFYRCIDPVESTCVATSEAGREACGQTCMKWSEHEIDAHWFSHTAMIDGVAANFVLEDACEALYGIRPGPKGSGPLIGEVYADPKRYGYVEVDIANVDVGALVVLPYTAGVVAKPAATAGDVLMIYASASSGGPKELLVKSLAGDAKPKFLVPARFAAK
jgi:hypothetical protein